MGVAVILGRRLSRKMRLSHLLSKIKNLPKITATLQINANHLLYIH